MIAYDLQCHRGHQFESWFKNLKSFEKLRRDTMIECPRCASTRIEIIYSAKTIAKKSVAERAPMGEEISPSRIADFIRKNFEDVGKEFAEEARRLHYGEAEPRSISGITTEEEEKDLREEGIHFVKIALPKPTN